MGVCVCVCVSHRPHHMHFHGLFVGLLGTVLSPAKMANLIKMLEGLTFVGPKEPHIKRGGVHIGATWRMLLNDLCL